MGDRLNVPGGEHCCAGIPPTAFLWPSVPQNFQKLLKNVKKSTKLIMLKKINSHYLFRFLPGGLRFGVGTLNMYTGAGSVYGFTPREGCLGEASKGSLSALVALVWSPPLTTTFYLWPL